MNNQNPDFSQFKKLIPGDKYKITLIGKKVNFIKKTEKSCDDCDSCQQGIPSKNVMMVPTLSSNGHPNGYFLANQNASNKIAEDLKKKRISDALVRNEINKSKNKTN